MRSKMATRLRQIEFVGGPFDGYMHRVQDVPQAIIACLVSPRRVDAAGVDGYRIELSFESVCATAGTHDDTSLAFYELQNRDGELQYCFWGIPRPPAAAIHSSARQESPFTFQSIFRAIRGILPGFRR
jgi:hypothetical protein